MFGRGIKPVTFQPNPPSFSSISIPSFNRTTRLPLFDPIPQNPFLIRFNSSINEERAKLVDAARVLNDFLQRRKYPEAEEVYDNLKKDGLKPNILVQTSMLKIFGRQGKTNELFSVLQELKESKGKPDDTTFTGIIDLYAKRGENAEMLKLFDWMKKEGIRRNKKTYNIMIQSFVRKGDLQESIKVFDAMKEDRVRPDADSYTYLISLFAKKGDIKKMDEYFQQMKSDGVQPLLHTFQELTSGYAIQGDLVNVEEIVRQMRDYHFLSPDATIWGNIIEANWKNDRFSRCFEILRTLEKSSNLCFKMCRSLLYNLKDEQVPNNAIDLWKGLSQKFERRNGDAPVGKDDAKDFLWFLEILEKKLVQ